MNIWSDCIEYFKFKIYFETAFSDFNSKSPHLKSKPCSLKYSINIYLDELEVNMILISYRVKTLDK